MARKPEMVMTFSVRFYIGNRLGAASKYSLVEFCVHLVEKQGLKEKEVERVVTLQPGQTCDIPSVMQVTRIKRGEG